MEGGSCNNEVKGGMGQLQMREQNFSKDTQENFSFSNQTKVEIMAYHADGVSSRSPTM